MNHSKIHLKSAHIPHVGNKLHMIQLTIIYRFKPGSHMPPTYPGLTCQHGLGHRYGICECLCHAGLPAKLSWFQLSRQAGGCQRLLAIEIFYVNIIWTICRCNVWHSNLNFSTTPYFTDGMVENCTNSICISRQLEYASNPSQMRWGPSSR